MNFKSLLKAYSIPLLIVVLAMCIYFFVFLGIKNDVLLKTQHLESSHFTQQYSMDSILAFLGLKTNGTPQQTKNTAQQESDSDIKNDTQRNRTPSSESSKVTKENYAQSESSKPNGHTQATNASNPSNEVKLQETKEYIAMFVQVSRAVVRSAPSTQSQPIANLNSGKKIEVVSFNDEWFEIKGGGYIAKRLVGLALDTAQENQVSTSTPQATHSVGEEASSYDIYEVLANRVNVRSAPSTESTVIASVSLGQTVRVSLIKDGWATITLDSGRKAYIIASAIRKI